MTMEQSVLQNQLANFMECAYRLHEICKDKLEKCYGNTKISLPVDIEKVVHDLGIKLVRENLNCGDEDEIDLNIAWLGYEKAGDTATATIYVDMDEDTVNTDEDTDTSKTYSDMQKYAIAYELGKMIIGEINGRKVFQMSTEEIKKWNMTSVPYSLPRLYAQWESFAYEMCAIFLLLPLDLFLDEFQSYIKAAKEHPVKMDKWIKYLGDKAGIPNYQLINGYQYIKFCAYQYYQEKYKISAADEISGTDYRDLYR